MSAADEVLDAAERRGRALSAGDAGTLRELLHPDFVWVSHTGEVFDLDSYLGSNIGGPNRWHEQRLRDPRIAGAGDVAVLLCMVTDVVDPGTGVEEFRMPMTQTWVRDGTLWRCLAGHAGPLLKHAGAAVSGSP